MAIDDLFKLTTGFIKGWKKGKLKETLKETAEVVIEGKIKIAELEEKLGQQQDEIRRLKGEQAKPKIKPVNSKDLEPRKKKKYKKSTKVSVLEIDESVELKVDKELPADAKKLSPRRVVIQEIRLERRNLEFLIERYYSPLEGKTYEGELPEGFKGFEFGAALRSFILYHFYKNRIPHRKIQNVLSDLGIRVSSGTINNILNNLDAEFELDLDSAEKAALTKKNVALVDDTGCKLNSKQGYTFGLSNEYFTRYTSSMRKNKEHSIKALGPNRDKIKFLVSDDASNFKNLLKNHQICWVHEIRKYKLCEVYKRIESKTLNQLVNIWRKFYKSLKRYIAHSSHEKRVKIESEFDRITSIKTHVKPLDAQLVRTRKNRKKLLQFLRYPKMGPQQIDIVLIKLVLHR